MELLKIYTKQFQRNVFGVFVFAKVAIVSED